MSVKSSSILELVAGNFLGEAPRSFKWTILFFLMINPICLAVLGPFVTGWFVVGQFVFTLAMSVKCYPLQSGGLIVLEALLLGLTSPQEMYQETVHHFDVIALLIFMVASVFFLKDILLYFFSAMFTQVKSRPLLSFLFCSAGAVLSAFLDALTVTAVFITVITGMYSVFDKVFSSRHSSGLAQDFDQFRSFLRGLVMHGVVGTALGGMCTLVGEPQNMVIGKAIGWEFFEFIKQMSHVTLPILGSGLIVCLLLEKTKIFGYGTEMPESVREALEDFMHEKKSTRTRKDQTVLLIQLIGTVLICFALMFHIAEVGLVGLFAIVFLTSMNGVVSEHKVGEAFKEAMPFVALLVMIFGIVSVIHTQHLFTPIAELVLSLDIEEQVKMIYLANGLLSTVSDNVFVGTIYINEIKAIFDQGIISKEHLDHLAVAINVGTNIPSIATPNGQAAFLFLLTSTLAPLIRLNYLCMVKMAFPYTVVLTLVGLMFVSPYG